MSRFSASLTHSASFPRPRLRGSARPSPFSATSGAPPFPSSTTAPLPAKKWSSSTGLSPVRSRSPLNRRREQPAALLAEPEHVHAASHLPLHSRRDGVQHSVAPSGPSRSHHRARRSPSFHGDGAATAGGSDPVHSSSAQRSGDSVGFCEGGFWRWQSGSGSRDSAS